MKRVLKKLRPFIFGGQQVAQRDKLVLEFIQARAKGSVILDAGAGTQRFRESCNRLKYISQDFGEYTGGDEFAGESLADWNSMTCDIISDIASIPLETSSVDSIICVEVFEHLSHPQKAIEEFARLLKPAGTLLITAPFNSQYHQVPFFYYSGFSSEFYKYYAQLNALEVVSITPIGNYYANIAQELLRLPFLKSGLLLKAVGTIAIFPAYLYVLMLHLFHVSSPQSPLAYVVELRKKSAVL